MLLSLVTLGGLGGSWAAPHDLVNDAVSFLGISLIVGGALGGLLLGGLCMLLCD